MTAPQSDCATRIRVAAVQVQAHLGAVQANLDHYTPAIAKAASNGAQLIVLPELAACGYSLSQQIWQSAETRHGVTTRWLTETARRHRVYLGIGFVEVDGDRKGL
jgi:predicted amidohydrolase